MLGFYRSQEQKIFFSSNAYEVVSIHISLLFSVQVFHMNMACCSYHATFRLSDHLYSLIQPYS